MANFIVILGCLFAGIFLKKTGRFPGNSTQVLNSFIIHISLPAVILSQIPALLSQSTLSLETLLPISMPWLHFLMAASFIYALSKVFKWSKATTGALTLTAGLGNTSFVGLPLLEALIGTQALPIGILLDQAGSFLSLSTLGIIIGSIYSGANISVGKIIKRVISFPPFLTLVVALIWGMTGASGHEEIRSVFEKLGATLVPIALFGVGFQLQLNLHTLQKRWKELFFALGFKLLLAPVIFIFVYSKLLNTSAFLSEVIVLEAAMAPMITSAVVASELDLDGEIANLMVGVGIPLSLISVPLIQVLFF